MTVAVEHFDVIVLGAGAAGLMTAATAGSRGRRVVVLDHGRKPAEKVRISGGGRCNFTNTSVSHRNFLSMNGSFCRSALARFTPENFLAMVKRHQIAFHEKHLGQLFCDDSAQRIIDMLLAECAAGEVRLTYPSTVSGVSGHDDSFTVETNRGRFLAPRLVVATGGLSIPKMGATDLGYRIARQFNLDIVAPSPALVPLVFDRSSWGPMAELAGISLKAEVRCGAGAFLDDLLFTHKGLSGPAILQVSSYWNPGDTLKINLVPDMPLEVALLTAKSGNRQRVATTLSQWLPRRLADVWVRRHHIEETPMAEAPDKVLRKLAQDLVAWEIQPIGTEGYAKAEVTRGGVDTRGLDSRTMEAKGVPGLYFVGEVVDVTGWLGGYNFQWAWASGFAAGSAV
ncbi:MAG: NAD(P)/FAD-dependent oxidoreductase [Rhodocyclaceae bacterium]|nr:NAD(P)/FAD-dependent oxidoreductase [Rhodocyclaceae bacterium]